MRRAWAWVAACGLALALPRTVVAAPPVEQTQQARSTLRGRVIEAGGSRQGVAGAVVLVVDAPADARPGKQPRDELDPEAVAWMHRVETDADGEFVLDEVPIGKVRVIVIAGGYARHEEFAEIVSSTEPEPIDLYLRPQVGEYRTEVRSDREPDYAVEPEHVLDGQDARSYAGSGDDPLLAAQNLPGVARSPLGFGLIGFRGGDPSEAGFYVDGHPVPRAFHVLPIASVLSPSMVARVQLSPGNYSAAYGSFGGGLVELESRPGTREGIHGQAHLDLFDVGAAVEGPVGAGSVHFGVRRSHVGDLLRLVDALPTASPHFWDYLGRFDYPVASNHHFTIRALGAGDRLTDYQLFDFGAAFHRFDLEYRHQSPNWTALISPSVRLDRSALHRGPVVGDDDQPGNRLDRWAQVYSFRAAFTRRELTPWLRLEFGTDVVAERWRRRTDSKRQTPEGDETQTSDRARGDQLRLGVWLSLPLEFSRWRLVPSARANLYAYSGYPKFRVDPRVDLRVRAHPRIDVLAGLGLYSTPIVFGTVADSGLISQGGNLGDGVADVPRYLIAYFAPNVETSVQERLTSATYVAHAAAGVEASLPWELEARATGFWREGLAQTIERGELSSIYYGRRRSYGIELLLRRSLAGGVLDGWLGYTLMWARQETRNHDWLPAVFDQRHNFVALLGANLPRGFRLGMRFRLVSGNPESPVVGREIFSDGGEWYYTPIRAPRGTTYQPLFHQLDLRLDKRWTLDRTSVTAYLDVQNVYNRIYPEVWIYTADWADRRSLIGLPIYPSLGVQVDF